MTFGEALETLNAGRPVERLGWNGKGMWLELWKPGEHLGDMVEDFRGQPRAVLPCIAMVTAQGNFQPGWLASQADMLADDWRVGPT
jgi:hypothetical protein